MELPLPSENMGKIQKLGLDSCAHTKQISYEAEH